MIERVLRYSQRGYYSGFLLILVAGVTGFLLARVIHFDKASDAGIACQSLVFILLLVSLPGALWWFHRSVEKMKAEQNDSLKELRYKRLILLRLSVVNVNIVLNILLFFLFADKSFFMCAAIAAIILLFCRPNARNIEVDLGLAKEENIEDNN
jgi:hypothetical protein